jgi:hypothetical protein
MENQLPSVVHLRTFFDDRQLKLILVPWRPLLVILFQRFLQRQHVVLIQTLSGRLLGFAFVVLQVVLEDVGELLSGFWLVFLVAH